MTRNVTRKWWIIVVCVLVATNAITITFLLLDRYQPPDFDVYSAIEVHGIETQVTAKDNLTSGACSWLPYMNTPVVTPSLPTEACGEAGNLYAPEILLVDGKYWMWYGAQDEASHDQIHFGRRAALAEARRGRA